MAEFDDNERFFRRIPNQPNFIKTGENGEKMISSAAFKDSKGCSVDRQAGRKREEFIVKRWQNRSVFPLFKRFTKKRNICTLKIFFVRKIRHFLQFHRRYADVFPKAEQKKRICCSLRIYHKNAPFCLIL